MDSIANFAISNVFTAPSPATSGTSLVVTAGEGVLFPSIQPFDAVIWPAGVQPTVLNAEIVRVILIATDTFTIVRTMYGTSARTVISGDQIAQPQTGDLLYEIENLTIMGAYL